MKDSGSQNNLQNKQMVGHKPRLKSGTTLITEKEKNKWTKEMTARIMKKKQKKNT